VTWNRTLWWSLFVQLAAFPGLPRDTLGPILLDL